MMCGIVDNFLAPQASSSPIELITLDSSPDSVHENIDRMYYLNK